MLAQDGKHREEVHEDEAVNQQDFQAQESVNSGQVINNYIVHNAPVTVSSNVGHADNCNLGMNNGWIAGKTGLTPPDNAHPMVTKQRNPETPMITVPYLSTGHNDLFSLLNPILDASHTRNRRLAGPDSACFPGTRQEVIKIVRSWVNSSLLFRDNPHIMWIFGYAGCGKSAIAQEIAELFARKKQLGASFFFFRGSGDRSRISRFATTIASQVASAIPSTAPLIEGAFRRTPSLLSSTTSSLSAQFQHLVYEPTSNISWEILSASIRSRPFLIVLDGLDECEDRGEVETFIEELIEFFNRHPRTPLRFLVTSRVENHIHQRLHSSTQVRLLDLVNHTSDADIAAALDAAIAKEKSGRVLSCNESWPSSEDRKKLVEHIGRSFIFMTTIIKFLFNPETDDGLTPMDRLPLVLGLEPDFDPLYRAILIPHNRLLHFQAVVSTVALAYEPLSIVQIADLLEIDTAKVANVLVRLHAIMQVPGDDRTPVTLWHTSLRDFLCSEGRSGSLFANPIHHLRLAYRLTVADSPYAPSTGGYLRRFAIAHLVKFLEQSADVQGLCGHNDRSVVDILNGPMDPDGRTALEVASRARNWPLVRALVGANAKVDVLFVAELGSSSNIKAEDHIVTALHAAFHYCEVEVIYFLLEKGTDPNLWGHEDGLQTQYGPPLTYAALMGDVGLVKCLLERGAEATIKGGFYGTALQAAACAKTSLEVSLEIVYLLLRAGADPNVKGGHYGSALHACAAKGLENHAWALLYHKADPDLEDEKGNTPLHLASSQGHPKCANCLLDFNADWTIKNKDGDTALQVARMIRGEYSKIVQALLRRVKKG